MDSILNNTKPRLTVSVRELVEFVLRRGDLGGSGRFVARGRALDGTRGPQRWQRSRPEGSQIEVSLSQDIDAADFVLRVQGRIDALHEQLDRVVIEEIKTVVGDWGMEPDPLHWAQARIYAAIYLQRRTDLSGVELQLTYLDLATNLPVEFRQFHARAEVDEFFAKVTGEYLIWAARQLEWLRTRDASVRELGFPFDRYRTGQRTLAVASYRTFSKGGRLFAEAPTGIGKTISVLFPAVKALGEGKVERIFYLTAKTVGRTVAEKAVDDLRRQGLKLRVLTLTARDKICFGEQRPCDQTTCPFALGYYDRVKDALAECLQLEVLNRETISEIARRFQVCPFALSLDTANWVDAVICDYNYAFDPRVCLRRFFDEDGADNVLLVDEAHNLVDRAREMYSASLRTAEIKTVQRLLPKELGQCARSLGRAVRRWEDHGRELQSETGRTVSVHKELPAGFVPALEKFVKHAEEWLVRNEPADFREALLELYFRVTGFVRTSEDYDDHYVTIVEVAPDDVGVRLFCVDPARLLDEATQRAKAAVFFSATLSPLEYFRDILGGTAEDECLRLTSPFPVENLGLLVGTHVATRYTQRAATYGKVADAIAALAAGQRGNYLVYFPSYDYLRNVLEEFRRHPNTAPAIVQTSSMSEQDREAFVAAFHVDRTETLVGFAVMGGIFGEGIDLVGERLVGAVVVGVGLPQISVERDIIRAYFDEKNGAGFDYAYAFPGMNRVLQAAGRVIRSESDRGLVLLLDTRFGEGRYWELFPAWWQPARVTNAQEIRQRAGKFWQC